MTQEYYSIITDKGLAKEAEARVNDLGFALTHLVIGDGNGNYHDPDPDQTSLINEVYRTPLTHLEIDPSNPNQIIAQAVIKEDIGPFDIREVGIFDDNDELFAIGKYPQTHKPNLESGSGKRLYIRMILGFSNEPNVNLIINEDINLDPNFVNNINNQLDQRLISNQNLNDVKNAEQARGNLGLGSAATANSATESKEGISQIATQTEVNNGTNNSKLITPKKLANSKFAAKPFSNNLISRKIFTSSGTWTKSDSVNYIETEVISAGGGGGGKAQHRGGGGGGGAGGYSYKKITNLNQSENITVGAGGNEGYMESSGSNGGSSSFGSHLDVTGGKGGGGTNNSYGGEGGNSTDGDLNIRGGDGGSGGSGNGIDGQDGKGSNNDIGGTPGSYGNGGKGGNSNNGGAGGGGGGGICGGFGGFGNNGTGGRGGDGGNNGTGGANKSAGVNYGGGGGGVTRGADGIVIVWEYS